MSLAVRIQQFLYNHRLSSTLEKAAYHGLEGQLPAGDLAQFDYFIQYVANEITAMPFVLEQMQAPDMPEKLKQIEAFKNSYRAFRKAAQNESLNAQEKLHISQFAQNMEAMANLFKALSQEARRQQGAYITRARTDQDRLVKEIHDTVHTIKKISGREYENTVDGMVTFFSRETRRFAGIADAINHVSGEYRKYVLLSRTIGEGTLPQL